MAGAGNLLNGIFLIFWVDYRPKARKALTDGFVVLDLVERVEVHRH
jgi:hypothetical protein